MSLVIGTNCGFVSAAPTEDPGGIDAAIDYYPRSNLHTSPIGTYKVVEIGWYSNDYADPGGSFQIGIYSDSSGVPGTLLAVEEAVLSGPAGWQAAIFNYELESGTDYWLAVVQEASHPSTNVASATTGADDYSVHFNSNILPEPWVEGGSGTMLLAVYAKYEVAVTYVDVAGSSDATSGATGAIDVTTTLAGSSTATSGATGSLDNVLVAGSSDTTSSVIGSLSVDTPLYGSVVTTSGAPGSLSVSKSLGRASIVEISGSSSLLGDFGVIRITVGVTGTVSSVSGTLGFLQPMAGSAGATSNVSAYGLNYTPLRSTVVATSGADGKLDRQPSLVGLVAATSSAVGVIGIAPYLIGEPMFWRPHGGIVETLEWKTNILASRNGTEQRIKGRQAPRQFFAMMLHLDTDKKNAWYNSILHSNQKSAWYVPVWSEYSEFTGDIAKGDTVINVDTKYADFRATSFAIIWKSDSEWEIVSVLSKNDSSLTLDYSIINSYADSCLIMPVRRCYLTHPATKTRNTSPVSKVRLVFSVWDNEDVTGYSRSTLWGTLVNSPAFEDCVDILDTPAFMGRTHTENSSANVRILDYQTGVFQLQSKSDFNRLIQDHKFYNDTKQACWEFRQYLCAMGGRQKTSLVPTFRDDLVQDSDVGPSDTKVNVENIAVDDAGVNSMRKYIGFYFESTDTLIVRAITGTARLSASIEQVTFDRSLCRATTVEPGDCQICFIDKCRLSSDKVVLRWEFSHRNECRLNFLRVT